MFKNKFISALVGGVCMLVLLTGIYYLPPIHSHLVWRMDEASTYFRVVFHPVSEMPTPLPETPAAVTPTPTLPTRTATPTLLVEKSPMQAPLTPTPTALPASASLSAPEYEKQGMNNCGPASLSTFLRYYGWKGTQDDIANILKSDPADRNVNVEELVYYVRNYAGWLNVEYRVGGDVQLLKTFLANGLPVMIEESMKTDKSYWPNDDMWAGHYLFINGYSDTTRTFVTQDTYYGPDMAVSYDQLEKNWQSFNHVYIVIYPPDQEEKVKSIIGADWDKDANRQHALEEAQADVQADPENPFYWFNEGTNLVYFERYAEAAVAFDKARKIGLPQRMLRYQFSPFIAYFNALRTDDLITIAKYAVNVTPNSEEAHLWLGWGFFRDGDRAGAESEFKKALSLNESYSDAQYALNYLSSQ